VYSAVIICLTLLLLNKKDLKAIELISVNNDEEGDQSEKNSTGNNKRFHFQIAPELKMKIYVKTAALCRSNVPLYAVGLRRPHESLSQGRQGCRLD
jgi:hypothetical protein